MKRTYYTDAKLAVARSNIAKYDWARELRDQCLESAERWAGYRDEKLRTLVVPPQVPRGYQVHNFGCPIHGVKVHEQGLYKWIIDFDSPFKITCPVGGEEYPSNDFGAFLESGMKDRDLLTGPYADDGWGWHRPDDPEEANYWFVAYYAHWSMRLFLMEAIANLGKAAILADDPDQARKYAHKCSLLLWQLSVHYPDYVHEKQSREGREHNPNYTGKLWNMIWEVTTPRVCGPAYDAIRPFLEDDTDLQELAGGSALEIDEVIRERLLREAARCITDGSHRIIGNYGSHQLSLLTLAQVMAEADVSPTTEEMIQYVLANPHLKRDTDMGLRDALENLVYRDGMPYESIGYNRGWVSSFTQMAAALVELGVDFFEDQRFRKLLTWAFDVRVAGGFTPSHGDTGDMFAVQDAWDAPVCRLALPRLRDPRMAWTIRSAASPGDDLFAEPADELLAELPDEAPAMGVDSFHFPAHGLANLQCGSDGNRTAVSFFYGSHTHHAHCDQLDISLFSHGNALLTDIGYPEQTDAFNHRLAGFFVNTVAHNTVVVDAAKQGRGPGKLHAYEPNGFAQFVDASCGGAYSDRVSRYRRANMLVEVTPTRSYLFDIFYVRGGRQHDYFVHGTQADFSSDPPLGPVQQEGTLAGIDVPYEQFYDEPRLKDKPPGSVPYYGYRGSGYQFLTNVQKAPLRGKATGEWRLTEPLEGQPDRPWEGIGLRAHLVGNDEELIACDGPVQKYQYLPDTVKFLLRRREGEGLASTFVTVFEPYRGTPWIDSVLPVRIDPDDGQAAAAVVRLADGSMHYLFHSLDLVQKYVLDAKVEVTGQAACLCLDESGTPVRAMLLNGAALSLGQFSLESRGLRRSTIVSVDYGNGLIEIADPILNDGLLPGEVVLVAPDTFADSLTLHRVIDGTHFSIGDEDLRVAGGPVLEVRPDENQILSSVPNPHARLGMTVLNSRQEPQGRLAEKTESGWALDRAGLGPLNQEDFPRGAGDSAPRYSVVVAGPGDTIAVPNLAQFERQ